MAGLTPSQKTALKSRVASQTRERIASSSVREKIAAQTRDGFMRSRAEVSPGSDGATRVRGNSKESSKDLSTQVSIAGVPLRLKSSHDVETVNELVRMVDEKIRQALPLTKTGSIQNASILAALNMAEELLILKRRARELVDGLEARVARVTEDLEKSSPKA